MSLKPSLLQAEKHQFSLSSYERCSSPLLIFMALLWIHSNRLNLYCTEDSSPGCNTAAGVSQEDRVEEANHLFPLAVYSSLKAVQDTGGLLYSKCLLLAQFQLFFHQNPQTLLCRTAPSEFLSLNSHLGLPQPRCSSFHLDLDLMRFSWAHFSSCKCGDPSQTKFPNPDPALHKEEELCGRIKTQGTPQTTQAFYNTSGGYALKSLS